MLTMAYKTMHPSTNTETPAREGLEALELSVIINLFIGSLSLYLGLTIRWYRLEDYSSEASSLELDLDLRLVYI
jgi:hypothetical protein